MSRQFSMLLLALAAGLSLVGRANAVNTLTGTIRDCNNNPVSGVTVYEQNVPYPSGTCSVSWSGRSGCDITDAFGRYTIYFPSSSSTSKICAVAVPEGDGWPACSYNCVIYKCCGGQRMTTTTGSVTVPASADNQTFTVNLTMSYTGSCYPTTPPENLVASNCTMYSIQLSWNGPSDGGCPPIAYDMRYSTSPITEANWSSATLASGEPSPVPWGTPQMWVNGLSPCTSYYFALKGQLHTGAWSSISNTIGAGTKCSVIGPCSVDAVTYEMEVVPARALALGAIRPNPAPRGEFDVSFTLANDSPAFLDLVDVVGRRVETHDLSRLGTGDHTLRIGTRARLSPGLYWVRLRQGEHKPTSRAFVVR